MITPEFLDDYRICSCYQALNIALILQTYYCSYLGFTQVLGLTKISNYDTITISIIIIILKYNRVYNDASIVESTVLKVKNACIPPKCKGFILCNWRGRRVLNRSNSYCWVFQVVMQLKVLLLETPLLSIFFGRTKRFTCGVKIMWCTALNFLLLICWWLSVQNTSVPKLNKSNSIFYYKEIIGIKT